MGCGLKIQPQLVAFWHIFETGWLIDYLIPAISVDGIIKYRNCFFHFLLDIVLSESED